MGAVAGRGSPGPGPDGGSHAVVVGGSMAGLLCARVLAGHFDHVTLFERDRFPTEPSFRAGVPQSRHLHVLLAKGLQLLEGFFPGLEAELAAAGGETMQWHGDVLRLTPNGWARRFPGGLTLLSASRELIEWIVRRRVAALPNLRVVDAHEVTGLLAGTGDPAIAGVFVRQRLPRNGHPLPPDARDPRPTPYLADLVVDASGRDSHAPAWLSDLGYPPPRQMQIDAGLGYASRYCARPGHPQADWKGLLIAARPDAPRGGGLLPVESGRWLVTLAGYGGAYPPTDEAGFLDFARGLRSSVLYDAIRDAAPLSPIRGYRRTANRWLRFDRLKRWPERFLVAGDAVCAFNPVYGQGMTAAALAAVTLEDGLSEQRRRRPAGDLTGLGRRFQRAVARRSAAIWLLATGEDLRFATTAGATPDVVTRAVHRYLDRVIAVSAENERVDVALAQVIHLLRPPSTLFGPRVLGPTLLGPRAAPSTEPPPAPAARAAVPTRAMAAAHGVSPVAGHGD